MGKKCITTDKAPKAIGPYSQAVIVQANKLIFCSGQLPIDPLSGKLVAGDVAVQAEQVLKNLQVVLEAAGSSMKNVVKTTVYLKDMDHFKTVNEVYSQFFESDCPARAAVQVAKLPLDVNVEIEAIAFTD